MEPSSVAIASVSETVQSDSDDPFADFEDFCLRISESDIIFDSSNKENEKNQVMIDSVKMIEATEGIKCNGDINKKIDNIVQSVQNGDIEQSDVHDIEQSEDIHDIEQSEDVHDIEQSENVHNKSQDVHDIEQSEDVHDIEQSEDVHDIEQSEDVHDIEPSGYVHDLEQSEDVQNGIDDYDSSLDAPSYDGFALYEDDDEEGKECVNNTDEKIVDNVVESLITQIEYAVSMEEDEEREKLQQEESEKMEIGRNDATTENEENDDTSSDMDIEPDSNFQEVSKPPKAAKKRDAPSDSEKEEETVVKKIKNDILTQVDKKKEKLTNGIQESVAIPGPSKPPEISSTFEKLNNKSKISVPELNEYIEAAITEWIADTGLVGHERTEYNRLKIEVVKLKAVVTKYQKQYEDVKKIIRKMIEERKTINGNPQILPPPAKVTRSVGLQVCTVGRRTMQPGSQTPVSSPPFKTLPITHPTKTLNSPPLRTGQPQNARKSTSMSQLQRRLQNKLPEKPISDTESISSQSSGSLAGPKSCSEPRPSTSKMDVVDLTDADEDVIPVNSSQIQIMSSNGEYKSQLGSGNATAETKNKTPTKKTQEVQPAKNPPLPPLPSHTFSSSAIRPPIPILRISRSTPTTSNPGGKSGIMLCWNFTNEEYVKIPISKYQVFAYQEGGENKENWKKVGDVEALPLPMACTLTQFKEGFKYYFAVRAVDKNMTVGEFSSPGSIRLNVSK